MEHLEIESAYKDTVSLLRRTKELSHVLNESLKKETEALENEFLQANKGKQVILITTSGEVKGILEEINKYRIEISDKGQVFYYNKNSLIGFYAES
ncbi:MAG TPA: hypothetical protein DHW82_03445 [Spirochaetia bacterium]|nr:MAG: hypothetical protein A2Y41_12845 [Spirochaetes bacterium GWB1_36_13]HCL56047.1 hypothetical protein [Spirochaetia bacterium]